MPLWAIAEEIPPDTERIQALLHEIEVATNTRDIEHLLRHATNDMVMVSKNGEILVGRAAVDAYVRRMLGTAAAALKQMRTQVHEDGVPLIHADMAIAHGTSDDFYEFQGGMQLTIVSSWTATLVRQEGEWKIASLHFSFNLFDNPLLHGARTSAAIAAGIALVCGLLVGLLYRRWRTLRR